MKTCYRVGDNLFITLKSGRAFRIAYARISYDAVNYYVEPTNSYNRWPEAHWAKSKDEAVEIFCKYNNFKLVNNEE